MVFDNNCLFLFKRDLQREIRYEIKIGDVDLSNFVKKTDDAKHFSDLINKSKIILYVDSENRLMKHLGGQRKGNVEKF